MYCDDRYITKRIIEKSGLKVALIDHEENMYGKGLILNLKDSQQKVFALSHELISDNTMHLHFKSKKVLDRKSPDWRPLPDMKFVWGKYARDKLISRCNYPDKILKITGNPKFDQLYHKYGNNVIKDNALKDYKTFDKIIFRPGHKKFLISDQSRDREVIAYNKLAQHLPEYDFIIKPHPFDVTTHWDILLKDKADNLYIVDKYSNIYNLICASDYILIRSSTSGFEAMILGKIVFIYNPQNQKILQSLPYEESGAIRTLHSPEELSDEVHKIEKNSAYRKSLLKKIRLFVDHIHPKNDSASKAIVSYIKEELRKPSKKI
jgi:CDP-glycerol glycerophosphotransferase (TagB/SpsB family)